MSSSKLVFGVVAAIAVGCGTVNNSTDAGPPIDASVDGVPPIDTPPPRQVICGSGPIEVLPNGGFDDPSPLWTQDPPPPPSLICSGSIMPQAGTKAVCLGGADGTVRSLTQQVLLPAGAKTVTLTGWRCITTEETATADNDILEIDLLDGTNTIASLGKLSNQQGVAQDCGFSTFTLGPVATTDPVSATLRLRSTLDSARVTSFFIDTLSLKVSCSP
jgi:hypothetical protein